MVIIKKNFLEQFNVHSGIKINTLNSPSQSVSSTEDASVLQQHYSYKNICENKKDTPNHSVALKCPKPKRLKRQTPKPKYTSSNMILLKKAMENSMLLNGGVEAEFAEANMEVRRKPLSLRRRHSQNRSRTFQSTPSPLSIMSNAQDL
ncbi:hypothetical protein CR513_57824, partial [Mucuna pruriens]